MKHPLAPNRSPAWKLFWAGLIGAVLLVPLIMVYALIHDRESQSQVAQASITAGWGGAQTVTGPVLVIPFVQEVATTTTENGITRTGVSRQRRELFISPSMQSIETTIDPDRKGYAIYETVVYDATMSGTARFDVPRELGRLGVDPAALRFDLAELRFGVSDPRGLKDNAAVRASGEALALTPGNGPAATGGAGFSAAVAWAGDRPLNLEWNYGLRGSQSLNFLPRGGESEWRITSA